MKEKVVLAYSGGLDTTAIIPWLKENFGYEVVCCCIDCGQGSELDGLDERAKLSGASKLYIEDVTDEFCDDYIMPCVQAVSYTHLVFSIRYPYRLCPCAAARSSSRTALARWSGSSFPASAQIFPSMAWAVASRRT